jgi:hypothetical protein
MATQQAMKRFLLIVCAMLLIPFSVSLFCFVRDRALERNFKRVFVGMTEQQVKDLMGRPSEIEACDSLGGSPKGCVKEYRYNPPYPVPYAWVVFIDSAGQVIDKSRYASW